MKKLALFLSLFLFQLFLSQQTNYEKKVSEIKNSFFTKMGLPKEKQEIWQNWDFHNDASFMKFMYANTKHFNQNFAANLKSKEGQNLTVSFIRQINEAKKYKTNEDIQKENYIKSDNYKVKYYAYDDIKNWFTKGEFEKTEDYNNRITEENSQAFLKKTILSNIKKQFNFSKSANVSIDLINYDADKELYDIFFKSINAKTKGQIKLSSFDAKDLKENLDEYEVLLDFKDLRENLESNFVPHKIILRRPSDTNLNREERNHTVNFEENSSIIFSSEDFSLTGFELLFILDIDFDEAEQNLVDNENIPEIEENIIGIKNLIELSNFKRAYQEINENLKITPKASKDLLIELHQLRAFTLFKSENFNHAISDYSKVLELITNDNDNTYTSNILLFRGICYISIGEKEKSCLDFNRSIELGNKEAINHKNQYCK